MARYLLIISLFITSSCFAGKHLLIINQQDNTFQADALLWQKFFMLNLKIKDVKRLDEYTGAEVKTIFKEYSQNLTSEDTLLMVVSAHTVENGNCTLLRVPNNQDIFDLVVFKDTYQSFFESLSNKDLRLLLIVNSCDPFTVFPPSLCDKYKWLTIVYTSEEYSIGVENTGSLFSLVIQGMRFPDMKSCVEYANLILLDRRLYWGNDKTVNKPILANYPQKSTMYGPNFEF